MDVLMPIKYEEVYRVIGQMSAKVGHVDYLLTSVLKKFSASFTPIIVKLAYLSFRTGVFLSDFKHAIK